MVPNPGAHNLVRGTHREVDLNLGAGSVDQQLECRKLSCSLSAESHASLGLGAEGSTGNVHKEVLLQLKNW